MNKYFDGKNAIIRDFLRYFPDALVDCFSIESTSCTRFPCPVPRKTTNFRLFRTRIFWPSPRRPYINSTVINTKKIFIQYRTCSSVNSHFLRLASRYRKFLLSPIPKNKKSRFRYFVISLYMNYSKRILYFIRPKRKFSRVAQFMKNI